MPAAIVSAEYTSKDANHRSATTICDYNSHSVGGSSLVVRSQTHILSIVSVLTKWSKKRAIKPHFRLVAPLCARQPISGCFLPEAVSSWSIMWRNLPAAENVNIFYIKGVTPSDGKLWFIIGTHDLVKICCKPSVYDWLFTVNDVIRGLSTDCFHAYNVDIPYSFSAHYIRPPPGTTVAHLPMDLGEQINHFLLANNSLASFERLKDTTGCFCFLILLTL